MYLFLKFWLDYFCFGHFQLIVRYNTEAITYLAVNIAVLCLAFYTYRVHMLYIAIVDRFECSLRKCAFL